MHMPPARQHANWHSLFRFHCASHSRVVIRCDRTAGLEILLNAMPKNFGGIVLSSLQALTDEVVNLDILSRCLNIIHPGETVRALFEGEDFACVLLHAAVTLP